MMKSIIGTFAFILITVILVISTPSMDNISVYGDKETALVVKIEQEEIVDLTDKFMDILVQEVDNNYKTIHVHSKDDLLSRFEEVTTRDVAMPYVDFYYHEEADGMYILPTETPPWFIKEAPYDVKEITNNRLKIIQSNHTEVNGTYTIEIELTYDDKWKITNITLK